MSWDFYTLTELTNAHGGSIQTGPFGSQLHQHEYVDEGVPVVMPKDIINGRVNLSSIAMVSEDKANRLVRHALKIGDIVFPRRGDIRKCALINEKQEGFLCGTGCLKISLPIEQYCPSFLYYYLVLPKTGEWLEKNAVGTTMLNLNTSILGSLRVPKINIKKQEALVSILSAYDDLIENNRRRIQLLEESARLLYNEWFVQLRFPGHEDVDVMDGVPVGWGRKSLGEVASTNIRSYKTKDLPEKIQYVDISSVCQGSIQSKKEMSSINAPGRAKRIAQFGDIVWSNVRPNLKAYALLLAIGEYDVFSTGFTIITAEKVPFTFLYLAVTTDDFVGYLNNQATGSSYPAVREADFSRATLTIPETSLLTKFDKKTLPLFLQVQILEQQNRALAQARDLLLPKLMNGEVSV